MSKKINQTYYSKEKYIFKNHQIHLIKDDEGYLFAKGIYRTKIKAEDLPEWFVHGRYYKKFGYISSKGIVDMKYNPNMVFNHFLRDDDLYISYKEQLIEKEEDKGLYPIYQNYDEIVSGSDILYFLKYANKFSNFDTTKIKQQIIDKLIWFKKTYPDEIEAKDLSVERLEEFFQLNLPKQ